MGEARHYTPGGERLIEVATEVFYREGIGATGVDTLAARSGVSKPTLYAQFGSKQALITEVLRRRSTARRADVLRYLADHGTTPREQVLAVFDWLAEQHADPAYRGCAFLNAAAEIVEPGHPARAVVADEKRWSRELYTRLLTEAGRTDAAELAEAFQMLADGASARVVVDGDRDAARRARNLAARLLEVPE